MEEKIKKIMGNVFEIDPSVIDDNSSPDSIEKWVSLKHMVLVIALEEEFNITFREDEIVEMLSFKVICDTVRPKISNQ
jgi:acyl carrier protein